MNFISTGSGLLAQTKEESESDLDERKKSKADKIKWTGLPLVGGNNDIGVIGGGFIAIETENGSSLPYSSRTVLRALHSNSGFDAYTIKSDIPSIFDSGLRWKFGGGYNRLLNAQFYGFGNDHDIANQQRIISGNEPVAENTPRTPDLYQSGDEITFNRNVLNSSGFPFNRPRRELRESQNRYFQYRLIAPYLETSLESTIGHSSWRWFLGVTGKRNFAASYKGIKEKGDSVENTSTFIDVTKPTGYEKYAKNQYLVLPRTGLIYDSRDTREETNPKKGIYSDLHLETSGRSVGSDYSYYKISFAFRQYLDLFPSILRSEGKGAVFAYRFLVNRSYGDIPFYEAGRISTVSETSDGVAGSFGVRGYRANQFVDRAMAMLNLELRLLMLQSRFAGGVDWNLLLFYDAGRVASTLGILSTNGLHIAKGFGIRIVWKETTVINASYGRSKDASNVTVSLGHLF